MSGFVAMAKQLADIRAGRTMPAALISSNTRKRLMALARRQGQADPMREEPMADVQTWIDQLRGGKVVGRVMLKN